MALDFWKANDYNLFAINSIDVANAAATGKVWAPQITASNYNVGTSLPVSTTGYTLESITPGKISGGYTTQNTRVGTAPLSGDYTMMHLNKVANPIVDASFDYDSQYPYLNYLICASMTWSLIPANGTLFLNGTELTITGTDDALNVFQINPYDVAGSGLNAADVTTVNIVTPADSTVLVNWAAPSFNDNEITLNFITYFDGLPASKYPDRLQYVVWNFRRPGNALYLNRDMYGIILAPEYFVHMGPMGIFGKSIPFKLSGSGATVDFPFLGTLPDTYDPSNTFYCLSLTTTTTTTTTSTTTTTTTTTSCQQPPVINSENVCLTVGDLFNPLEGITAYDCSNTDITTQIVIITNTVDTSQAGLYTVTYQVASPQNGKITQKQIYVRVLPNGPYHQAISGLIESIALEQTSLSHILNAEGEKIQKALALNASVDELLLLNQSVQTITQSIANLEIILQAKLEAVNCGICPHCDFPAESL